MALGKEQFQTGHLRIRQPEGRSLLGLLAETESSRKSKINGS